MTIKEKDFVEIEYTGKITDGNIVFDTTSQSDAKAAGIFNPQTTYKPMTICIGQGHVLKGIDKFLVGKEIGKEYTSDLTPEDGLVKKRADLIQLIATQKFKNHGVNPVPGLQVNIDNTIGLIKTVTGGRTLVDFNHPCAGKNLNYKIKITKEVTDSKQKVQAMATMLLGNQFITGIDVKDNNATITLMFKLPDEVSAKMAEKIKQCVPELLGIHYLEKKQDQTKNE